MRRPMTPKRRLIASLFSILPSASSLTAAASVQGFYAWRKLMLLSCYEIGDRVLLYLGWRKEDGLSASVKFKYGELAEYLGVNRTALYRATAKLCKSGKIRIADDTLALV